MDSLFWLKNEITNLINQPSVLEGLFLYLGSLSGLISVVYVIFGRSFNRPLFKFNQRSSSGIITKNPEDNHDYYNLTIQGQLKNCSEAPNSISEIHYVIWENERKRNRSLAHGLILGSIQNKTLNKEQQLPIYFREKEGFELIIKTTIVLTGTHVEELVHAKRQIGNAFTLPKHTFNLAFVDTSGNFFDENGRIRSEREMGLWWTLPNTFNKLKKGNFFPCALHFTKIIMEKIKFTWTRIKRRLGL